MIYSEKIIRTDNVVFIPLNFRKIQFHNSELLMIIDICGREVLRGITDAIQLISENTRSAALGADVYKGLHKH